MLKNNSHDIVISGGGIAGAALAVLLGRFGLKICLLDPYPPKKFNDTELSGRTSALMEGSINLLSTTQSWERCLPSSEPLCNMRIVDTTGGNTKSFLTKKEFKKPLLDVDFCAQEIGLEQFGYNICNDLLRAALWEEMNSIPAIKLMPKIAIEGFEATDTNIQVTLSNNKVVNAKLLIGADGRKSKTRDLAGIEYKEQDYAQKAITCLLKHENDHKNISTEFHTPNGPFTLVPLPQTKDGKYRSSLVWVDYNDAADDFMSLDEESFEKELNDRSLGRLGQIEVMSKPQVWPLASLRSMSLINNRVALIAEAAHVLHPLGAQGLNLSLRDVAVLAETIADAARSGMDIGNQHTLQSYSNARKADIKGRAFAVDKLHSVMTVNTDALHTVRRTGLKLLDKVGPIKQIVMQHGVKGPNLDSRLLNGQAL